MSLQKYTRGRFPAPPFPSPPFRQRPADLLASEDGSKSVRSTPFGFFFFFTPQCFTVLRTHASQPHPNVPQMSKRVPADARRLSLMVAQPLKERSAIRSTDTSPLRFILPFFRLAMMMSFPFSLLLSAISKGTRRSFHKPGPLFLFLMTPRSAFRT